MFNHQDTKGTKEDENIFGVKINRMAFGKEFLKSNLFFVVLGALGVLVVQMLVSGSRLVF